MMPTISLGRLHCCQRMPRKSLPMCYQNCRVRKYSLPLSSSAAWYRGGRNSRTRLPANSRTLIVDQKPRQGIPSVTREYVEQGYQAVSECHITKIAPESLSHGL